MLTFNFTPYTRPGLRFSTRKDVSAIRFAAATTPADETFNRQAVVRLLGEASEALKEPSSHTPEGQNLIVRNLVRQAERSGLPKVLIECIAYATDAHKNQKPFGEYPYNYHILTVARLVAEHGGSLNTVLAGLLHDIVEDQGGLPRLQEVKQKYGDEVAHIVEMCSYSPAKVSTGSWQKDWINELYGMLAHLKTASPEVRLVKKADMKHNVSSSLEIVKKDPTASFMKRFALGPVMELWKQYSRVQVFKTLEPHDPFLQEVESNVLQLATACRISVGELQRLNPAEMTQRQLDRMAETKQWPIPEE